MVFNGKASDLVVYLKSKPVVDRLMATATKKIAAGRVVVEECVRNMLNTRLTNMVTSNSIAEV